MRNLNEINLSSGRGKGLDIRGNGFSEHSRLGGLGFEESGHTGFQKELTKQQLEQLDLLQYKEDKANKISEWKKEFSGEEYPSAELVKNEIEIATAHADEAYDVAHMVAWDVYHADGTVAQDYQKIWYKATELSKDCTDEEYPSAKAVFDGIQAKTGWELIDSAEITQDISSLELNLAEKNHSKYKELFWRFTVPTQNAAATSGFSKARTYLYVNNNVIVSDDQTYYMQDNGYPWFLSYHIQSMGNFCSVFKGFHYRAERIDTVAYTQYTSPYVGWQAGKDIGEYGLSKVKILMISETSGVRKFLAGTKYELWGVRA